MKKEYISTKLTKSIKTFDNTIKKIETISFALKNAIASEALDDSIEISLELNKETEKLINLARLMPICTGVENANDLIENLILEENNINIEYLEDTWFHITFPTLIPKKKDKKASYIRTTLQIALKKYFEQHTNHINFDKYTVIFKYNYTPEYEIKKYIDHDNFETKAILDIIALYVLKDDNPYYCGNYHVSTIGDSVNTEVFVIPHKDFKKWLLKYENQS